MYLCTHIWERMINWDEIKEKKYNRRCHKEVLVEYILFTTCVKISCYWNKFRVLDLLQTHLSVIFEERFTNHICMFQSPGKLQSNVRTTHFGKWLNENHKFRSIFPQESKQITSTQCSESLSWAYTLNFRTVIHFRFEVERFFLSCTALESQVHTVEVNGLYNGTWLMTSKLNMQLQKAASLRIEVELNPSLGICSTCLSMHGGLVGMPHNLSFIEI